MPNTVKKRIESGGSIYPGHAVTAEVTGGGFKLSWTNRVRMTSIEKRLLCDFLCDAPKALLRIATLPASVIDSLDDSFKVPHKIVMEFLRLASQSDNADELASLVKSYVRALGRDEMGTTPGAVFAVHKMLFAKVVKSRNGDVLSESVNDLIKGMSAAAHISFNLDINETDNTAVMLAMCNYSGEEIPITEAPSDARGEIISSLRSVASTSKIAALVYNNGDILDRIVLNGEALYTFLCERDICSSYGISYRIPNTWKKNKGTFTLKAKPKKKKNNALDTDELLKFNVGLFLDGQELTADELTMLMNSEGNMVTLHGKWVEIRSGELKNAIRALKAWSEVYEDGMPLSEIFKYALRPVNDGMGDDESTVGVDIVTDDEQVSDELFNVDTPSEYFTASLRPYQIEGVKWLNKMRRLGLGVCLSDDMGLGKTVQAIAMLEQMRQSKRIPSLVVIPSSLLRNWQNELERFAPKIRTTVLHSSYGDTVFNPYDGSCDVYITTYSMLTRIEGLKNVRWESIIIDEAQAIKNPDTLQSQSIKKLKAKFKLAMTGTPVENSILDLWSIFEFLNPDLFSLSDKRISSELLRDGSYDSVKRYVSPFILRRLKTDKSVIAELPEKIEMDSYCKLTRRQAVLYNQVVNSLSERLKGSDGIERRGIILSGIMKLKQVCNHPDQYIGYGAYTPNDSGKLMRLMALCEDIRDRGEKVLVFTQFKEMCMPIDTVLEGVFKSRGFVIHGGIPADKRGEMVDAFNNGNVPYMVLSLRAGGVGFNLTAANHVIHFDRWWNPAVENQATDRAFRIGQQKNVIVHRLITVGTLEERISEIIEGKQNLAGAIVDSGMKVTEMSDEELAKLLCMDKYGRAY